MSLIFRAVTVSDAGLVRANNEDAARAGQRLIAVADGMGGPPAGEVASDIVIRALDPLESADGGAPPLPALRAAVEAANERIREVVESSPANHGMGTTVTALLLGGEEVGLVHVGDSRCYLLRDAAMDQLTRDDTFVQGLIDQGVLSAEEARSHPQRSLVTRAVQGEDLTPACGKLAPRVGDRFLVCSDGLSDYVVDQAIASALGSYPDRRECAEQLIKLAWQAGAPDNVTVVVADVATA